MLSNYSTILHHAAPIDDDGSCHLEWDWVFKIKKDWTAAGDEEDEK
jgi:hypothetical protein